MNAIIVLYVLTVAATYAAGLSPVAPPPPPHIVERAPLGLASDLNLATNPFYQPLWEMYSGALAERHERSAALLKESQLSSEALGIPQIVSVPAAADKGSDPMISYQLLAGYGVTARLATIANPLKHWHVYTVDAKEGTCIGALTLTSVMARMYNCTYATNGGPFNMVPTATQCAGAVVSDGVVTSDKRLPTGAAAFGLTKDGQWSMGFGLNTSALLHSFDQLVTGFGWLVYNGSSAVSVSGGEIAPRTTIGVNAKGELLSFVAEGSETAYTGLTMQQTAEWMIELGMLHAINLDGGGSSVSWWPANSGNNDVGVQGCPTCIDIPFCCERSVETMLCVK